MSAQAGTTQTAAVKGEADVAEGYTTADLYPASRLERAAEAAARAGLDALLLTPGPDLRYLTGYDTHQSERLTCLAVPAAGPAFLVVPRLELASAQASPVSGMNLDLVVWDETDDPYQAVALRLGSPATVGLAGQMWAMMVLRFRDAMPGAHQALASSALRALRIRKTTGRVLREGDAVVVDIGGTMPSGYCSDCTRTYAIGAAPPDMARYYEVLRAAQEAACAAVRPGIHAEAVDAVARDAIAAAGHGEHFTHRTGHGIGLETHEDPYIVAGNTEELEPGMAFSVEPGIYPGPHGARIEDIVVCTASGYQRLNNASRDLVVVGT